MRRIIFIGLALSLAACGNDDNNATNNTTTANNTTANNTTANNTTANNTTANNTTANNTIVDCGAVTFEGECSDATTILYCDEDFGLVEVDCVENFGATSTCGDIPDYGAECIAATGDACELYDADLDDYYYLYCGGVDAACVWSATDTVTCQAGFPVASCDETTFAESCSGDFYIYSCSIDQALAVDCAGIGGGTCDAALGCVMPAGAACDDTLAVCAVGMTCTIPDGEDVGTCG